MAYRIKGDLDVARNVNVNNTLTVQATAIFTEVIISSDTTTYKLPSSAGGNNQVLTSNGTGVLYWSSVSGIPESKVVTSSAFSIINGSKIGFTHNLQNYPDIIEFELVNVSAEFGYSVGDKVQIKDLNSTNIWNESSYGLVTRYNTTTVSAIIGQDGIKILDFTTGIVENVSNDNWEIVIKVIKI